MTRRIAFLYASFGAGSKTAALALEEWCKSIFPDSETICRDLMDFMPRLTCRGILSVYNTTAQRWPSLWNMLYLATDANAVRNPLPAFLNLIHRRLGKSYLSRLRKELNEFKPHAVFTTHFFGMPELLGKWDHNIPIYFVGTDYLTHAAMRDPRFDGWFVGSEEALRQYVADNMPTSEYAVKNFGIPVSREYLMPPNRKTVRRALETGDSVKMISVAVSGRARRLIDSVMGSMVDLTDWKIFVLCRDNKKLFEHIRDIYYPFKHIIVLENVSNAADYFAASDLVILEPNGAQIAEACAAGAAMLLLDPLPGLGVYNCDYILERGAARKIYEHRKVGELAESLIKQEDYLQGIRYRAHSMSRPNAASDILTWAMEKADAESRIRSQEPGETVK